MLYNVPQTANGPDLMFHKATPLAEQNALNQARRSRVFPQPRRINSTIALKNGKVLRPKGVSGLSVSTRLDYKRKASPYLSRRTGMSGITDFFSGITDAVKGTVSAVSGTVTSVAGAAQPIEQLLQNNPSLVNLVKSYIPTAQQPTPVTVVAASPVKTPITAGSTMGVSNKIWLVGALGMGGLALVKMMGHR